MLKADMHIHIKGDPIDKKVNYTAKELIDYAAKQKFEVLAITCHNHFFHDKKIEAYANKKGIILIPGIEKTIERKHVLIYNIGKEAERIQTFTELQKLKKKGALVIAPHPYFILPCSLGKKLEKNINLFDAIEYSSFCNMLLNFNKKAEKIARKHGKPLIGNSDLHAITQMGKTYTLINAKKEKKAIIEAIKKGNVKVKTQYMNTPYFLKIMIFMFIRPIQKIMNI